MKKMMFLILALVLVMTITVPALASDFGAAGATTTISTAGDRTAAVASDGTLWMWGNFVTPSIDPKYGGMDMGYQKTPVKVMSDVVSVSCSDYFTAAIKKDGSLWMWGLNERGQLGNGRQGDSSYGGEIYQLSPIKVMDDVAAVSLGYAHTAVIKTDNSLWVFGCNQYGQIGNNNAGDFEKGTQNNKYKIQTTPVKIMDNVIAISCGRSFTAAIKEDGTLWTWGENQYGQLGNGESGSSYAGSNGIPVFSRQDVYVPQKIMDNVVAVSCGDTHAAAIKNDGSLWIWGMNSDGCLGFGSTSANIADGYNSSVPLKVMEEVSSVYCGNSVTAAIKMDGSLWMWGLICSNGACYATGTPTKMMEDCLAICADGMPAKSPEAINFVLKKDGTLYGWGKTAYLGLKENAAMQYTAVKILSNIALPRTTNNVKVPEKPSSWAKAEVDAAIVAGLVPENLQKNYQQSVSRGNVAQMFVNLIEKSTGKSIDTVMAEKGLTVNASAFTDTSDKAVLAANALGIINGTGNGKFSPNETLTRAQIAAIINRVASVLGTDTDGYTHSFIDVSGHWASSELGWPSSVGIINGVGNNKFDPDAHLTTEQAIAIAYRALQVLKK